MSAEEVQGLNEKELDKVWVHGRAYAPALHVRKWSLKEMRKGYLFHSEFNDCDTDSYRPLWAMSGGS